MSFAGLLLLLGVLLAVAALALRSTRGDRNNPGAKRAAPRRAAHMGFAGERDVAGEWTHTASTPITMDPGSFQRPPFADHFVNGGQNDGSMY